MSSYAFGKAVSLPFDTAITKVTEALAAEQFGVLSDIDIAGAMKKKLNKDMPPYRILGACNPGFASQALDMDPHMGALLPCNVVVRQDDAGVVFVEIMDPGAVLGLVGNDAIVPIAAEVRAKLERALATLS